MSDGFARSFLFVPANRPTLVESGFRSAADALVFDLEDSVGADEKDAARDAVRSLLLREPRAQNASSESRARRIMVRVNTPETPDFATDLRALRETRHAGLVVPKIESTEAVHRVVAESDGAPIVLLLETPRGILRALDLADAAGESLVALGFGAEDFRTEMRVDVSGGDALLAFARASIAVAAAAAGVPAIDAPEMDFADHERLRVQACMACASGFLAKFAIHPAQLEIIHEAFGPTMAERAWAERVTRAYEEGAARGHGSTRVDDRVVDTATMRRARQILEGRRA